MKNSLKREILFIALITLYCGIITRVSAQDASVFDRLSGKHIQRELHIVFVPKATRNDPAGFHYLADASNFRPLPFSNNQFTVSNDDNNTFRLYIGFYNPLKYKINSEMTQIDDPVNVAVSQYLSSLVGALSPSLSTPTNRENILLGAGLTPPPLGLPQSVLLNQWIYQFTLIQNPAIPSDDPKLLSFFGKIKEINDIESYLFGPITIDGNGKDLNKWIQEQKSDLYSKDNFTDFSTSLSNSKRINSLLTDKGKSASAALKDLNSLLTDEFENSIKPLLINDPARIKNFKNYSQNTALTLAMTTKSLMDNNNATVLIFTSYLNGLETFIKNFDTGSESLQDNKYAYRIEDTSVFTWQSTKMNKYVYSCVLLNEDGTEKLDKYSTTFNVAKYQWLVPFVSTGVLYTKLSYTQYGLQSNNGINTIVETDKISVGLRPAIYLNLLTRSPFDFMYPFLQAGVSTGVNDAIFPFGGGLLFRNTFSISGGLLLGYHKELNKFHVGEIVSGQNDLNSDLINTPIASWYLSINLKFGK